MALIKCRECGGQVSLKASACPKCGEPPPSPEELKEKTKNSLIGWGAIIGICLVLFIGNSVINAYDSLQEETAREDYFSLHKEEILSTMQSHMDQQSYSQALSLAQRYRSTKDIELLAMKKEAEEKEIQLKRLVSKFGRPPIVGQGFSGYTSPEIEIYLRLTAHDPDSIELENCTEVKRTRQGWLVGCTYRGRNGFGGVVKNANWFTIRHEQVVNVESSSSYSWQ